MSKKHQSYKSQVNRGFEDMRTLTPSVRMYRRNGEQKGRFWGEICDFMILPSSPRLRRNRLSTHVPGWLKRR